MEIKWSLKLIEELKQIVSYLKKNEIGGILEQLANFFLNKHLKYLDIKNYSMGFSEQLDPSQITDGEFRLAFICELINSYPDKNKTVSLGKKKKKVKKIKRPKGFVNVYFSFSAMLKYCIGNNFKLSREKIDYKGFYLTNILKNIIIPENKQSDVLTLPYFLTKELMFICREDSKKIYKNSSLILKTEELDLTILTKKQIGEILNILNTKKTIFVRILLVLAFETLREDDILNELWMHKNIIFGNYEDFISVVTSPLIETLIFITHFQISNNKKNKII